MDLLALGQELIAANTVSHRGTEAAVSLLRPLYEQAGLEITLQEVVENGVRHQNLLGTYAGADRRGLLLVTHLDTVDPGPYELWTETNANPYALTRRDDALYGLGTADTKLDALCKLFAARDFKGKWLRRSLQLLGTFGEEVGCRGAKHFVRSPDFTARFAACSEPSELTLIRAHKGYAVVKLELVLEHASELEGPFERITFHGKSAHSSTPHLGINAIEKAIAELGDEPLVSLEGGTVPNKVPAQCHLVRPVRGAPRGESAEPVDKRSGQATLLLARELFSIWKNLAAALEPHKNPGFSPDSTVVNWGVCRLSGPRAELIFDCRLLPGHAPSALLEPFAKQAVQWAKERRAQLKVDISRANPAMELKEPSELLQAAREACRNVGLSDVPEAKPTNTEAGVFSAAGIEAIVFGPGRSTGNAHCANEHNRLSQMKKAIEFYRALISKLCT